MIAERSGHGGPGDRRERPFAMPLDAFRVGTVQRQSGEELGRHAPAAARVVGRTRLAGAPGLRSAQIGEQLGLPPHRGEAARAADVPGQEALVDGERAGVDVADRVDQADHPARAAQVQARQRVAVGGQVKERVAGQHLLAAGLQPVVELPLLGGGGVQLVPDVRSRVSRSWAPNRSAIALKSSSWPAFCLVTTTEILKPLNPSRARFSIARSAVAYEPGPRTASLTSAVA